MVLRMKKLKIQVPQFFSRVYSSKDEYKFTKLCIDVHSQKLRSNLHQLQFLTIKLCCHYKYMYVRFRVLIFENKERLLNTGNNSFHESLKTLCGVVYFFEQARQYGDSSWLMRPTCQASPVVCQQLLEIHQTRPPPNRGKFCYLNLHSDIGKYSN